MHPDLWTVPVVGFPIRTYGFCVAVAIVVALVIAIRRAKRVQCDPATVTTMSIVGLVLGMIGCRLMHVVHYYWQDIRSGAMGVGDVAAMGGGGEILGGIILAGLGAVVFLRLSGKPVLRYLDIVFPPMILAMGIGRIGCLMFGCCWGGVCMSEEGGKGLPWAVRFPYGSPAYLRHCQQDHLHVPDELMWMDPKQKELAPIPRSVLAHCEVDNDEALSNWVDKVQAVATVKRSDPNSPKLSGMVEEVRRATAALGGRPHENVAAAAIHLRNLASRPGCDVKSWEELRTVAAKEHSLWVHPAQVYDAIALFLLFVFLSLVFRRAGRPGTVVAWAMILYPINRVLQECIRRDNPHDVLGFTVSQAISVAVMIAGIALLIVLTKRRAEFKEVNQEIEF